MDLSREHRRNIRKQMEFYFSDANLNRDNYMRQTITSDSEGYVSLNGFLNFNKIRKLTQSVEELAKALEKSKKLELNESKTAVRRCFPMKEIENVDERIVYVECLPSDATHEWIKEIFSACGQVVYISLPRYKSSGQIKQFAFVEYATTDGAKKACETLNSSEADEKIGKFPVWNKTLYTLKKRLSQFDCDEVELEKNESASSQTETDDSCERMGKKRKINTSLSEISETCVQKKKSKTAKDADREKETNSIVPLHVIPKSQWLKLKSDYVTLQKENMKKLRKSLQLTDSLSKSSKPQNKKPKEETAMEENSIVQAGIDGGPQKIDNVIIQLKTQETLTKQKITDQYSSICSISYIEILPNDTEAIIRCKDPKSASELLSMNVCNWTTKLMQGDEEELYWQKIRDDRQKRFNNKQKGKKKNKHTAPLNKKIIFD